jgi:catechol 2,3-dioxygenase-like lactoylglutathione lyase family enzyme
VYPEAYRPKSARYARRVIRGLDHVQVAAPPGCETKARRFYGELLGLPELEKPEPLRSRGGVWFRCGEQQLHVGVDEQFEPARKAHPALAAAGYEELLARLREAGVDLHEDDSVSGLRRSYVHDPWGNRLELVDTP